MSYDNEIILLRIMLPQTGAYINGYDGKTKCMYFLIKHEKLLQNYDEIWNIVNNSIKNNLIASPCTIKKFPKSKIKPYSDLTTYFHHKELTKVGSNYIFQTLILINIVLKKGENY